MHMKTPLLFFVLSLLMLTTSAQITSPVVRANFGVDADLKARSLNGSVQTGDDWYVQTGTMGNASNGTFVIDTTGAAAILAGYAADVSPFPKRMQSFYRTMSQPAFSVVNNRLWLDALFIRDFHGNDASAFTAGSDKNGMSPANWSGGTQGVPDKNDILDMFMHIRRAGPNTTDSLWMFGGLSLDNVTGNRYFDFEMYQTDIYYDQPSGKWFGYGPDAGHTAWKFDASGNVIKAGDIIFSAEYQSSSLSNIEARIWIDRASLSITPAQFNWSGQFDGANTGSQYGYASILPKQAGTFYTGLQSGNNEWAGVFSLVLQDNSVATTYTAKQFMEFSVNLSKLGLDPAGMLLGDICGTPFNRMVVKTRASASFTAELKDFVAPIDLFLAPRANAIADVPLYCGSTNNSSNLQVTNPSSSSVYTWSTPNGNILTNPNSPSITVTSAGMYIVRQQLMAGCSTYAQDTVYITYDPNCTVLDLNKIDFSVDQKSNHSLINWTSHQNTAVTYYEVEKSTDGKLFQSIGKVENANSELPVKAYTYEDAATNDFNIVYYRLKITSASGVYYTRTISIRNKSTKKVSVYPNPVINIAQLEVNSEKSEKALISVYNSAGEKVHLNHYSLSIGQNIISINKAANWQQGVYLIRVSSSLINHWEKFVVGK